MNRLNMSPAAAALFRALLARSPSDRDRILLTEYRSTDWQSLTFVGERHEFRFRIAGPEADEIYSRLTLGLEDADVPIPRQLLADVWGSEQVDQLHYLRIYMGHLRGKIEDDPAQPRYLLTELGVGYRLADDQPS